ncbi:MAG: hypothetical protein KJ749_02480, partial [Planctomycetes bacterium]|nr:hypothetical protein [Planctomycetota bacterium]
TRTMSGRIGIGLLGATLAIGSLPALADDFVAFSLREAQNRARLGSHTKELYTLGGITRLVGAVYDVASEDIVLVGRAMDGLPESRLDDLVVALRSRLVLDEWPAVSIDPTDRTSSNRKQAVTFSGGLDGTSFGRDFLHCDVVLKSYSLGLLGTVPHVKTYRDLASESVSRSIEARGGDLLRFSWLSSQDAAEACEKLRDRPVTGEDACQIQFWFYCREPYHVKCRNGVFWIDALDLTVRLRVLDRRATEGGRPESPELVRAGKAFAEQFAENLSEVTAAHPGLKRLKVLFDLIALSDGIRRAGSCADLSYFLDQYRITTTTTPEEHEQVDLIGIAEECNGSRQLLRISGGIRFETQLKWLNDGDVATLRAIVLETRPAPSDLSWKLPLDGWHMPNAGDLKLEDDHPPDLATKGGTSETTSGEGFTVTVQSVVLAPEGPALDDDVRKRFVGFFPPPPPPPQPVTCPGGVSMRMIVSGDSFVPSSDPGLDESRKKILTSRPSADALSWPAPMDEGKKCDEED